MVTVGLSGVARSRGGVELVRHAIEQRILLALELVDRTAQRIALAGLGIGVAAHLVRLGLGERSLRHERAQPGVVGLGLEERALLVGDRELGAQTLEPIAHVDEPALEQGLGHRNPAVYDGGLGCGSVLRCHAGDAPTRSSRRARRAAGSGPAVRRHRGAAARRRVGGAGHFPDALFRRCGELGFLGLHYPARCGGSDGDLAAGLVFVEELARCGAGAIPMAISVQTDMATPALAEFGTDDQRERWLGPAIAGTKIGAIAITEPDAGSDVAAIRTRAVRDGDVWRINGRKMFITNGARAHFLTLVAQDRPRRRAPRCLAVHRRHVAAGRVGVAPAREARHARVATPPRSRSTTSPSRTTTSSASNRARASRS